jgi:hypothetical protein
VTDCYCGSESIVKTVPFKAFESPVACVVKVLSVMRAGKADIVWKNNITSNVLIAMYGICG